MNPGTKAPGGDPWKIEDVCIHLSRILRGSGGIFLVGAGLFVFFDAKSQINDSPLDANVIYLQAMMRLKTVAAISVGAYILSKLLD